MKILPPLLTYFALEQSTEDPMLLRQAEPPERVLKERSGSTLFKPCGLEAERGRTNLGGAFGSR